MNTQNIIWPVKIRNVINKWS